ncbi:MAG: hypothetical protein ABIE07_00340 [Candidatus Zixiibacteriota bacterium]
MNDMNNINLSITNFGVWGAGSDIIRHKSCEYPVNSHIEYLSSINLWFGGVVDGDTLVSTGTYSNKWSTTIRTELFPDWDGRGELIKKSAIKRNLYYAEDAVSDLDLICTFTDTMPDSWSFSTIPVDSHDDRYHKPLNISVTQKSYTWTNDFTRNFIIFDLSVKNVGEQTIEAFYLGLEVSPLVGFRGNVLRGISANDEVVGFIETSEISSEPCFPVDTINMMWFADNDGDPENYVRYNHNSAPAAVGLQFLRLPEEANSINFNWYYGGYNWSTDFGPRLWEGFREFHNGIGTPTGDKNKYYMLSHREVDYDQMLTMLDHQGDGFMPPPSLNFARDLANGHQVTALYSAGPVDIDPGDSTFITVVFLIGDNLHKVPWSFFRYFDPTEPQDYYNRLNFNTLFENAKNAKFTFDNPGVDTDGDGNLGRYIWKCKCEELDSCYQEGEHPPDTTQDCCFKRYFTGDGIPDFQTASPPPPPFVRTISEYDKMTVRWNGQDSEEYIDFFTQEKGFEGYRVYFAENNREQDFVMVETYDRDDFKVFQFFPKEKIWKGISLGTTRDSLEILYGSEFDPELYYDEAHALYINETNIYYYFVAQNWNNADLSNPRRIHKVYPYASRNNPGDTTLEGYLKFYEYEYTIENLQPSKPYYFSVTAFNRGSFDPKIGVMESSPLSNAVRDYPLPSSETVQREGLNVMVFPNPYRIDGGYARAGYENRNRAKSAERSRAIHFANLPPICTIRIYTVDGDLVRELKHFYPDGGPGSQEETWNVISRNTQAITTGMYIWHVRSDMGDQIGKLVIMK